MHIHIHIHIQYTYTNIYPPRIKSLYCTGIHLTIRTKLSGLNNCVHKPVISLLFILQDFSGPSSTLFWLRRYAYAVLKVNSSFLVDHLMKTPWSLNHDICLSLN